MPKVLIVDDERSIRRTLGEFLREARYDVVEAEDTDTAIQHLSAAAFDVVVTDIILPRVTGVELLRQIQTLAPDVPVVMMTGEPTVETAAESVRAGAVDYLFKPITKTAILRTVANCARLKSLADSKRRLEAENRAYQENLEHLVNERTAELRASEQRARECSRFSQGTLDGLSAHICVLAEDGTLLAVNAAWVAFAEANPPWPRNAQVGGNYFAVCATAQGEGAAQAQHAALGLRAVARGEAPEFSCEYPCHSPEERRWFLMRATRFAGEGAVRLVVAHINITARCQAEDQSRKLARAVDQSPVSILITDCAGNIEFANPKFSQVTGYSAAEVLGKNPRLLKSGETSAEAYRQLWQIITAGKTWQGEFHNKRKDGTLFWETASISPVRDAAGAITHFIAVKEDVTEKKLSEARWLRAQRVESIGSLASGIAHDINNILAPIILSVPLLRTDADAQRRREIANTIEVSAQRAVAIVREILAFARGKDESRQPVQVRHLIRDIAKIARETFPRSIRVEILCAADLWLVPADATQMHQVLLNLCINARDAMPAGGTLTLRAHNVVLDEHFACMHKEARPGPHVRIEVEDTGTGIAEDIREHIFESFFTTKGADQGTGLGLATVKGIVLSHHGFIGFRTAPGMGTTFELHLPAIADGLSAAVPAECPVAIPRGQGEIVLVVDDEPILRDTTRRTLERNGYGVLLASDGSEALAQFEAHPSDIRVVVTDCMMPHMDGVTLCQALRAIRPDIPIVVSSGGLLDKLGKRAMLDLEKLDIRQVLYKPHTAEVLLRALHEAISASPKGPALARMSLHVPQPDSC
jgi:PAS domain S-box-containing protein